MMDEKLVHRKTNIGGVNVESIGPASGGILESWTRDALEAMQGPKSAESGTKSSSVGSTAKYTAGWESIFGPKGTGAEPSSN